MLKNSLTVGKINTLKLLLPIDKLLKVHAQEMVETLVTFCLYQTMDLENQVDRKLCIWKMLKETNPKINSW